MTNMGNGLSRRGLLGAGLGVVALGAGLRPARATTVADIKKRGTLRVAIDLGLPPYGMIDAALKPTGSDVETAQPPGRGSRRRPRHRQGDRARPDPPC